MQDRERAMKLAEEARVVPAAVEEIEVQSQTETSGPSEPAQESMSTEALSTEPVPVGAPSADGNEAKMQPTESEQSTAASASAASAPVASAPAASAPATAADSDSPAAASYVFFFCFEVRVHPCLSIRDLYQFVIQVLHLCIFCQD